MIRKHDLRTCPVSATVPVNRTVAISPVARPFPWPSLTIVRVTPPSPERSTGLAVEAPAAADIAGVCTLVVIYVDGQQRRRGRKKERKKEKKTDEYMEGRKKKKYVKK